MMLQPTSGRRGFDYVKNPIDTKSTPPGQVEIHKNTTNTLFYVYYNDQNFTSVLNTSVEQYVQHSVLINHNGTHDA
ncbi:unnamed protein product [Rotaria socialis]